MAKDKKLKITGKTIKCGLCDKEIPIKNMTTHRRKEHNMYKTKCPFCEAKPMRTDNLQKHIRRMHQNEQLASSETIPTKGKIINKKEKEISVKSISKSSKRSAQVKENKFFTAKDHPNKKTKRQNMGNMDQSSNSYMDDCTPEEIIVSVDPGEILKNISTNIEENNEKGREANSSSKGGKSKTCYSESAESKNDASPTKVALLHQIIWNQKIEISRLRAQVDNYREMIKRGAETHEHI